MAATALDGRCEGVVLKSPVIYIGVLAPLDPRELVYKVMEQVEQSGKSPLK